MAHREGFKNHVEKVAIVGASGNCGKFITEALLRTGKHVVSAITRTDSNAQFPHGVQVKRVDYDNPSSIVDALGGQDALVITMAVTAPKDQGPKLIEAAAEANVPWVFPNDWGLDAANETLAKDVLIGDEKVKHHQLTEKLGKSSWIAVATGFWYEWSLAADIAYGFDLNNRCVTLFDDGETPICTSTFAHVGRTMASLLSLKIHLDGAEDNDAYLDKFKNRYVYVSSFTVSQKDMLASVLRVTQTSIDDWKVTKESAQGRYAAGMEQMKKGDRTGFTKLLYSRVFYPDDSGNFEKTRGLDNGVLGLPKDDIDEHTKIAIQRAKDNPSNRYP